MNYPPTDVVTSIECLDRNDLDFLEQKLENDKKKPKNGLLLLLFIAFVMPVIPRGGKMMVDSMNYSTAVLILLSVFSMISIYLYYEMIIKLKKDIRLNRKIRYVATIKKKEKSFFKRRQFLLLVPIDKKEYNKVEVSETEYNAAEVGSKILLEYSFLTRTFLNYKIQPKKL